VWLPVFLGSVPVTRRIKKGELMDRPLLDWNFGKSLQQRLGSLSSTEKWRDKEQGRFTNESLGEFPRLRAAKVGQGIEDMVCGLAAGVGETLTMPNQKNPRGR
jgi:hypothetical protein